MYSILDDIEKYRDKGHKCKKPPSRPEQVKQQALDYPDWMPVRKKRNARSNT